MEIEQQKPVDGYAEGEEPMVFYYNRERRLQRAPENVRDYYENGLRRPHGFFGVLFCRKGNKILFLTMIFAFVFVAVMYFVGPKKSEGTLCGVSCSLTSVSIDEIVHVRLSMKKASSKVDFSEISGKTFFIEYKAVDSDGTVISNEKIATNLAKETTFLRTTFHDYGIIKVECVVSCDDDELLISSLVESR